MVLLIRGLVGLVSLGLILQVDCATFLALTGFFPGFQPLIANLPSTTPSATGPTLLVPTTKTVTTGVFLAVENNTSFNVQAYFSADGQVLIAEVPTGQTLRYELAPTQGTTTVTAQTVDLNGTWSDSISGQILKFVNGALDEFIDENGLTHVFSAEDIQAGQNVFSQGIIQRNLATNSVAMAITTDDPNAGSNITEARLYDLQPGATGTTLAGSSVVSQLDATGATIAGTEQTLSHSFTKQFPNTLQATREVDLDPQTGAVVQDLTYDPPPAEVRAGVDYEFGQTITFRINATTVSFVVSGP